MAIKGVERKTVKVMTDSGKTLHLIAPGFFLNNDLHSVYQKTIPNIEFDDLFLWMCKKYYGDQKTIKKRLYEALATLSKRGLIEIDENEVDGYETHIKKEIDLKNKYDFFPITQIDIVMTKECNFSCKHCYLDFNEKSLNKIDTDKLLQKCEDFIQYGLQSVVITGGEPLLCDGLMEVILFLVNKNIRVTVLTNGYLIDEPFAESIMPYKHLITIQVSLDGSNSNSHDQQRNKIGAFDATIQGIRLLKKYGIYVVLSMVLSNLNISDIYDESMFKLARELGVDMLGMNTSIIQYGNATKNDFENISEEEIINVVNFVHNYEFDNSYPSISISGPPSITKEITLNNLDILRPRCRRGINSFAIRPDGQIVTCSDFAEIHYNEYDYGNILEMDFTDIIQRAKDAQESIMNRFMKLKGICSICTALGNCGGACRADAYAEYNDILAPYPLCQRLFDKGVFPREMIDNTKVYTDI